MASKRVQAYITIKKEKPGMGYGKMAKEIAGLLEMNTKSSKHPIIEILITLEILEFYKN